MGQNPVIVGSIGFGLGLMMISGFIFIITRERCKPFNNLSIGTGMMGFICINSGLVGAGGILTVLGLAGNLCLLGALGFYAWRKARGVPRKFQLINTSGINMTMVLSRAETRKIEMRRDLERDVLRQGARKAVVTVQGTAVYMELLLNTYDGQEFANVQKLLRQDWGMELKPQ